MTYHVSLATVLIGLPHPYWSKLTCQTTWVVAAKSEIHLFSCSFSFLHVGKGEKVCFVFLPFLSLLLFPRLMDSQRDIFRIGIEELRRNGTSLLSHDNNIIPR
jgi:hypothetical protein